MRMFSAEISEAATIYTINMWYFHQTYKFNSLKDQDSKTAKSHIRYYICTILSSLKPE